MDFAVAGALDLLVDDVVHLRAGIDERRGEDRETAAFLDIARRAEEALGTLQRVGIHAAGQHLAGGRHHGVVGARQPGDRIQQDHHVLLVLHQTLGLLDRSEEHTSELQSPCNLVCRLLLEKKERVTASVVLSPDPTIVTGFPGPDAATATPMLTLRHHSNGCIAQPSALLAIYLE